MLRSVAACVFVSSLAILGCGGESGGGGDEALETTTPVPSPEDRAEAAGWGHGTWMDQHRAILELATPGSLALGGDEPPPVPRGDGQDDEEPDSASRGGLELVFLGDSITQGWGGPGRDVRAAGDDAWRRHYAGTQAANFGISGDRTQHVLWRIDRGAFDLIEPKAIVVMIGTNNLADDAPADIAAGIEAIVDRLEDKAPGATILVMSIVRGRDSGDPMRVAAEEVNDAVRELGQRSNVRFVDLGSVFYESGGAAKTDLMHADFIHFTPSGYEAWARAMQPDLDELLR